MASFSDAVKKYGSTKAAFEALGYTKNENGSWVAPAGGVSQSAASGSGSASGGSASSAGKTENAAITAAKDKAYQAAQKGDWDAVGNYVNEIAFAGEKNAQGGYDFKDANDYMSQLQKEFGYNANDYYQGKYDAVYGEGAWDGGTGTGEPTYNEFSQSLVDKYNAAVANGGNPTTPQVSTPVGVISGGQTGAGGGASGITGNGGYDLSETIKKQAEAELEAKLAALKGAYDKSSAALDAAEESLPEKFNAARNEIAARNAIEKQAFDERAASTGLNTGTTGQAELARSSILQRDLAGVAQEQAKAQSDIDLQRAQLEAQLQAGIAEATAGGEAELAGRLYEELVRVQTLNRADAQLAAEREAEAAELAAKYGFGTQGTGTTGSSGTTTTQTANPKPAVKVDNGGLSSAAIKAMQTYFGVNADGMWGPASAQAAGNKTASQAWAEYSAAVMPAIEQSVGMNRTATGQVTAIKNLLDSGKITEEIAEALLVKFNLV